MYSLYIDTHFKEANIVLYKDGSVLGVKSSETPLQSTVTMPLIDEVLKENMININDIKEIYCINGPGSFTGVRIGITIAKTIAMINNIIIKSTDYLEIMSIHQDANSIVSIPDNHGAYIGYFQNYVQSKEYQYINREEYLNIKENNKVAEHIIPDYVLIYNLFQNKPNLNPHLVNPLYIKNVVSQ